MIKLVKFYQNFNSMEPIYINPEQVAYLEERSRVEEKTTIIHMAGGERVEVYQDLEITMYKLTHA